MAKRPARRAKAAPALELHIEQPGPTEIHDPHVRRELQRASVWFGLALLIIGIIVLAQPLMLIIGGMIFAVFLDGGTRLLGRVLPIGRGYRLAMVLLLGFGFIGWVFYFAGSTLVEQAETLRVVIAEQWTRLLAYLGSVGMLPEGGHVFHLLHRYLRSPPGAGKHPKSLGGK